MAPSSLEGQSLGKYRILEPLGRGGMAQVYKAYHPLLDRYVAVKILRSDLVEEEEFLARFRRDARAVAALRHPNIVQIYDFDVQNDLYYMVMELLEGDTLKAYLNTLRVHSEKLPLGETVRIFTDVLSGLAYAHGEGIIHRDLKPANIMLTKRGQAVLTDFGIAQIVGGTQYTVSGALMGTLSYMAPEQGLNGHSDARSDIYSLGIAYYDGHGVKRDSVAAVKWFTKAAEQQAARAQSYLGFCYLQGDGVKQDYQEAVKWYRMAAEQGDADAQFNLGRLYHHGHGVPQDDTQSAFWYRKAAEQGNAEAQYMLGLKYNLGDDVPQDYTQAATWYRKAAEQGVAGAQFKLGLSYKDGRGVPQDDSQAAFWFRKAAEQGYAEAQFLLGLSYYLGLGVPQDYAEAYFLLDLAIAGKLNASNTEQAAKFRVKIASHLTPADQSRVQQRVRKWFEAHQAKPQ